MTKNTCFEDHAAYVKDVLFHEGRATVSGQRLNPHTAPDQATIGYLKGFLDEIISQKNHGRDYLIETNTNQEGTSVRIKPMSTPHDKNELVLRVKQAFGEFYDANLTLYLNQEPIPIPFQPGAAHADRARDARFYMGLPLEDNRSMRIPVVKTS